MMSSYGNFLWQKNCFKSFLPSFAVLMQFAVLSAVSLQWFGASAVQQLPEHPESTQIFKEVVCTFFCDLLCIVAPLTVVLVSSSTARERSAGHCCCPGCKGLLIKQARAQRVWQLHKACLAPLQDTGAAGVCTASRPYPPQDTRAQSTCYLS